MIFDNAKKLKMILDLVLLVDKCLNKVNSSKLNI